jgi:2-methylisocitrate lyase-like PEP mutase family enzyme
MKFQELHKNDSPLLIFNVWDAASAKVAEELGFDAIGTSSSAIANLLGYEDGEQMSFQELLFIVKRISASSNLPLSVDLEAGYSRDPAEIVGNIKQLAQLGVAGINLEDSLVTKGRHIQAIEKFAGLLAEVKRQLANENVDMFINVRIDTYLLGLEDKLNETLSRITAYQKVGADGIFVPKITAEDDIQKILANTDLPLNVLCFPNLPNFETLANLGVKRISMGNFLYDSMSKSLKSNAQKVLDDQSFEFLF